MINREQMKSMALYAVSKIADLRLNNISANIEITSRQSLNFRVVVFDKQLNNEAFYIYEFSNLVRTKTCLKSILESLKHDDYDLAVEAIRNAS